MSRLSSGFTTLSERALHSLVFLSVVLSIQGTRTALAQPGKAETAGTPETLPENKAVLELSLPPGATVRVDGTDYGTKRVLSFEPLTPGKFFQYGLTVRFRAGGEAHRTLLMRGGRRVSLTLAEPDSSRPELVLQSGHHVGSVAF